MNGFTKAELTELKYWLEHADDSVDAIDHYNLMNKLHSMIDNYCNHEWQYNQHEKGQCSKCGVNE